MINVYLYRCFNQFFLTVFCLGFTSLCFAKTLEHVTLNVSKPLLITKGEALTINDSVINVTLDPKHPNFIQLNGGQLSLKNNIINVKVADIVPTPHEPALYYLLDIQEGNVELIRNKFNIVQAFTVGLLMTNTDHETRDFVIDGNRISQFHGGFYLFNSHHAFINNNQFMQVSFSNIYNSGNDNIIKGNNFIFAGNFVEGDSIDVINSSNTQIRDNIIASSASYGIYASGVRALTIENNRLLDSQSYGIGIGAGKHRLYLQSWLTHIHLMENQDIHILHNSFSQNRFGITAERVAQLNVKNNLFTQKFDNNDARVFWTDNTNLLTQVAALDWQQNFYKEAFTQEVPGDNTLANKVVDFPAQGGVHL